MSTVLSEEQNTIPDLVATDSDEDELQTEVTANLVRLFKLLADETRLKILFYLFRKGELNVRTLCGLLNQSQPAVSHHLALLRVSGLIDCRRAGKHNFYRVLPGRFRELKALIGSVASNSANMDFEEWVRDGNA